MVAASNPERIVSPGMGELSARDADILAFERQWWRYEGSKEASIREHFDMNSTRYYQRLNQLLDQREAIAYAPALVHRLRARRRR